MFWTFLKCILGYTIMSNLLFYKPYMRDICFQVSECCPTTVKWVPSWCSWKQLIPVGNKWSQLETVVNFPNWSKNTAWKFSNCVLLEPVKNSQLFFSPGFTEAAHNPQIETGNTISVNGVGMETSSTCLCGITAFCQLWGTPIVKNYHKDIHCLF